RGWLDLVRVLPFPAAVLASLARSPEARLLSRLEVVYDMRYHPFGFDSAIEGPNRAVKEEEEPVELGEFYMSEPSGGLPALLASPFLGNLRAFKLGFSDTGERVGHSTMVDPFGDCTVKQMIQLLGKCPRLEELYLNTDLRGIADLFSHRA